MFLYPALALLDFFNTVPLLTVLVSLEGDVHRAGGLVNSSTREFPCMIL